MATVQTARLTLGFRDEVAKKCGARRKRHVVHIPVQGLVHSEHKLSHRACTVLSSAKHVLRGRSLDLDGVAVAWAIREAVVFS